uniref:CSON013206 protein n=2 Tax=Culicoides sonorensis TaxID=179676 RepID=A0A336M7H9_CULSO
MKPNFIIIDYKFNLIRCELWSKSGRIRFEKQDRLSYGEFPSMPVIYINPYQLWFFYNELKCSKTYRKRFSQYLKSLNKIVVIKVDPPKTEALDYHWGAMTSQTIWECIELDYIMSWLSTLGGAFSALGDYKIESAEIAGKISIHQMKLAMRIGDPITIARCKLYLSISLIQKNLFKAARMLIIEQYRFALTQKESNRALLNMCLGIWNKMRYMKKLHKTGKTLLDFVNIPPPTNLIIERGSNCG